jgi:hydroxypyruvate isomerase
MTIARREMLAATVASLSTRLALADQAAGDAKGKIQHSVCKWCYPRIPLFDLANEGKRFGLQSIELLGPSDWPVVQQHGLTCAMATAPNIDGLGGIPRAFNRTEHHDKLVKIYSEWIPMAAKAGIQNIICFSGNRDGMDDETGLKNCAIGLKRLMSLAEEHKVNIVMELLNSKVNHKDYMCDRTPWGAELCKQVGSERFKLLYDIYHMQIMEGDVIATIRKYHQYIAHYHTGGVPGRNEIDETQELYYPAIVKAIAETGYRGFIGQEFIPKREDQLASLKQGIQICTV